MNVNRVKIARKYKRRTLLAGNDTVVRCPKCGRTQALLFKNGLKNGWLTCCGGLTMPIIFHTADVYQATTEAIQEWGRKTLRKAWHEKEK
jgi:transcription elongation factor Elf1